MNMQEQYMEDFAELLEHELSEAVEVKNQDSLHRYIRLMVNNLAGRREYEETVSGVRSDIRELTGSMRLGFEKMDQRFADMDKRFAAMDQRFEDMDKRFEDVNQRFKMMFAFISNGFILLATISVVFKFLA
jgi:hypothetical protein